MKARGVTCWMCLVFWLPGKGQWEARWPVSRWDTNPKAWSGYACSQWGRGEWHTLQARWQRPFSIASKDIRLQAYWGWEGFSKLMAQASVTPEVQISWANDHWIGLGLGLWAQQTSKRLHGSPKMRLSVEFPLGPTLLQWVWVARWPQQPNRQRQQVQQWAMVLSRQTDGQQGSLWMAWNASGFRFAATSWFLNALNHRNQSLHWGFRFQGPPSGLQLGLSNNASGPGVSWTIWLGMDAWGGQFFSHQW